MTEQLFDYDAEFRLGIDAIDNEHIKLVDMLNTVHALLGEGQRDEARRYFNETLSGYVVEHFAHEEQFMASISYPFVNEHRAIHEDFKQFFYALRPRIAADDEGAFRQALNEVFTWIVAHIGRTDKQYATFYLSRSGRSGRT